MRSSLALGLALLFLPLFPVAAGSGDVRLAEIIASLSDRNNQADTEVIAIRYGVLLADLKQLEGEFGHSASFQLALAHAASGAGRDGEALLALHRGMALAPFDHRFSSAAEGLVRAWERNHPGQLSGYPVEGLLVFRFLAPYLGLAVAILSLFPVLMVLLRFRRLRMPLSRSLILAALSLALVVLSLFLFSVGVLNRPVILIGDTELLAYDSETAPVLSDLPEGLLVSASRERAGWYRIVTPDGRTGWIPTTAAGLIEKPFR